jgi:hypothetical protein
MPREIIRSEVPSLARIAAGRQQAPDEYKDRLVKYIPGDVIAIYLTMTTVLSSASHTALQWWLSWVVFGAMAVCTPLYLSAAAKINDTKQIIVSSIAFVVWACSLGAPPFEPTHISWWDPVIPAFILPFYTFVIPLTDK